MFKYREISASLTHVIKVFTEILTSKKLTEQENSRVKYCTKVINEAAQQMLQEQSSKHTYPLFKDDDVIGMLHVNNANSTITLDLPEGLPAGEFNVSLVLEKDVVFGILIEQ